MKKPEPVPAPVYPIELFAQTCIEGAHRAAAAFMRERDGVDRTVTVSLAEAAASFSSEKHVRVNGAAAGDIWAPLSGDYRARDGRWIRLHCNFPHHEAAVLAALQTKRDRAAVEAAVGLWDAMALEDAIIARGGAAGVERSIAEWTAHPQYTHVAKHDLIEMKRIGPAPKLLLDAAPARPLEGIRVLDLSRVLAGPVCGRILAAYGADVLRIGAAHLPTIAPLVIDTGFGKRFAEVDLRTEDGVAILERLIAQAHIVVQAYRPGALARRGFGPAAAAAIHPGIIYVSIAAYGSEGPWGDRRGFDSLVQMTTGISRGAAEAAGVDRPVPLPMQALDHGTGWLAAAGAIEALSRRIRGGDSWDVRLSLARTALHLASFNGSAQHQFQTSGAPISDCIAIDDSPFGRISHVRFPGSMHGVDMQWRSGPHPQGFDAPRFV